MEKDEKLQTIDLGFADLLGDGDPIGVAFEEKMADAPTEQIEEKEEKIVSYDTLWREEKYQEIITLSEAPLVGEDNPILRKVWWVRAQTAAGELPKQVLCSSLEECLAPESYLGVPMALIEASSLELAKKLHGVQEEDLAIAILERCFSVSPNREVAGFLLSLIQDELGLMPNRVTFHSPNEMKKRLHLLNLKRSIDDYLKHNPDGFEIGEPVPPSIEPPPSVVVQGSGPRLMVPLILLLLLLVTSGIYFGKKKLFPEIPELFAGTTLPFAPAKEKLSQPEVSRIKEISQLASVMYDVEKRGDVPKDRPTLSGGQPSVQAVPRPKSTIDTAAPVETEKMRQILEGRGKSRYEDAPLPRFPRSDDRDLSRAPITRDPRRLDEERRYDPNRAETWEGGQRYEVLINTSVMDRPSFHAGEVAELYAGDRVLVEARIGRWLRLRSVKGKPGYILAQDAEKLYD